MKQIHLTASAAVFLMLLLPLLAGCGSEQREEPDFYTSGSQEADQRAEQRMAKARQLSGKKDDDKPEAKLALYERLGGGEGIKAIVEDFIPRAMADPRVNWERRGVKRGGLFGWGGKSIQWQATEENVNRVKWHMIQFLSVATGGPSQYEGRPMREVHQGMKITNAQFDASVGDLKATLDKLQVPTPEQKELLAIIESTRPEIAEER